MSTGEDRAAQPGRTLASRLDYLFRTIRNGDEEFTHRAVARAITERGDTSISHTAIANIRNGTETNPKLGTLTALARFFGVDVAYLTRDAAAEDVAAEVELAAALARIRESDEARTLVVRTRGLSDNGLRSVLQIVNTILEMEQSGRAAQRGTSGQAQRGGPAGPDLGEP
ncbi:helix-turn-helix transcriptional regulator [Dactylosporangium sp. NPDC051485]|uniref:helix-turn-helix domain-containing protein n=1 Tax=Dactylosporangium sp. NPDC051485 TaxID=3154846 RepID=UPI003449C198